jgi:hypothetical protein
MTFSRFNSPVIALGFGMLAAVASMLAPSSAVADTATLNVPITIDIPSCSNPQVSGTPPNLTITCGSSSPTAGTCSLQASTSPSPLTSAGGQVNLSAVNCTGAVTSYGWTRTVGGTPTTLSGGATASDTLAANSTASSQSYTYGLQWCVGTACASKSVLVAVPSATGGGVNPGGTISCSGFNKTLVIDVAWTSTTAATRYVTQQYGGFGANDALVVRFTPPAGAGSYSAGSLSGAEYSGPTTTRVGHISTSPCDFSLATRFTLYNGFSASTFNLPLQVGGTQLAWTMLAQPGTTYYLNIKNTDSKGVATCAAGKYCDMFVDFYKPLGT